MSKNNLSKDEKELKKQLIFCIELLVDSIGAIMSPTSSMVHCESLAIHGNKLFDLKNKTKIKSKKLTILINKTIKYMDDAYDYCGFNSVGSSSLVGDIMRIYSRINKL